MKSKLINAFFIFCLVLFILALVSGFLEGFTSELFGLLKITTVMQATGFMISAYIIYELKPFFLKLDKEWIDFLIMFGFISLLIVSFEVLFVFHYWFTQIILNGTMTGLDKLNYVSQSGVFQGGVMFGKVSLNVMSKLYTGLFFIVLYFLYTLIEIRRVKIARLEKFRN